MRRLLSSGEFWLRPEKVYVFAITCLWAAAILAVAAGYVALRRATGVPLDAGQFALAMVEDLAIGAALGVFLYRFAKGWAARRLTPAEAFWRCLAFSAVLFGAYLTIHLTVYVATHGGGGVALWLDRLGRAVPSLLADYSLFWAVAISVVPTPFLRTSLDEAKPQPSKPKEPQIVLASGQRLTAADVLAITAAENYVELNCAGRTVLHRATMAQMEKLFGPPDFLRVHRASIVRADQIVRLVRSAGGATSLETKFGQTFSVSRTYIMSVNSIVTSASRH